MAKSDFIHSPMDMIATPPAGNKGGPGVYDGEEGYEKRTHSPNAVPEKVRDGSVPTVEKAVILPDKMPKDID